MTVIKDVIEPGREVIEGKFQGVIQSHKVDSRELRLGNNPEEFLRITYPSSALGRALERINEKLSQTSNQSISSIYGSGKGEETLILTPMERKLIMERKRKEGLSAIDRTEKL